MKIHILSTSDTHGFVYPSNFAGDDNAPFGLSRAKSVINEFKENHPDDLVFVVDNGDFIQGSPMTNFIAGKHREFVGVYDQLAKTMGYDFRAVGNHEFNYGVDYLKLATSNSDNILNANFTRNGKLLFDKPYEIVERNGIKIGFLGLTTEFVKVWEEAENIKGVEIENPVETAKKIIPKMREEGAEIVVIMYHAGFEADMETGVSTEDIIGENRGYEMLQTVPGIDALVTGHQHRKIALNIKTPFGEVPSTQPGEKGMAVGVITLDWDGKEIADTSAQIIYSKDYQPNKEVLDVLSSVQPKLNEYLDTVIGELDQDYPYTNYFQARLNGHPILDLVSKVQGLAVDADISATALFNNQVPGFNKQVTRRDIVVNYLYPNYSVKQEITGAELIDALEQSGRFFVINQAGELSVNPEYIDPKFQMYNYELFSGIDYTIDVSKPMGSRVVEATIDGENVDPNQNYQVAISNYRANGTGGYTMFDPSKNVKEDFTDTSELLEKYIEENSPIVLKQPNNIHIVGYEKIAKQD